jgi:hypothetical protein
MPSTEEAERETVSQFRQVDRWPGPYQRLGFARGWLASGAPSSSITGSPPSACSRYCPAICRKKARRKGDAAPSARSSYSAATFRYRSARLIGSCILLDGSSIFHSFAPLPPLPTRTLLVSLFPGRPALTVLAARDQGSACRRRRLFAPSATQHPARRSELARWWWSLDQAFVWVPRNSRSHRANTWRQVGFHPATFWLWLAAVSDVAMPSRPRARRVGDHRAKPVDKAIRPPRHAVANCGTTGRRPPFSR